MRKSRFDQIHQGLSLQARQVYSATPISEPWGSHQIAGELARIGVGREINVVRGCLASLVADGLVREPQRGIFIRVAVKDSTPSACQPENQEESMATSHKQSPPVTAKPDGSIDLLAPISADVRKLSDMLRDIAEKIDAAAMDIEERAAEAGADSAKLKQLQALLKGLA